ncbi:dynein light chain axonemal [Brachionus plicatilis]|uniref:Dynein axonemal light chain 1 n=1 Tax=Brachionus plicatilis TaxID=10195 RepID=A0A3M7RZD0_BRAPC|nr:dynein light chain axonemal [Brachionus plicatilis]
MFTTIDTALEKWEEENKSDASKSKEVKLNGVFPPIVRISPSISKLTACERFSLSTNMIEKISYLNGFKNLRVLSLGRNLIRSLSGIEVVGDTLEELWISYNQIEKLKGISALRKLKVLYFAHNLVKEWTEFDKLKELTKLEILLFVGNPLRENFIDKNEWTTEVTRRLLHLKKLDSNF